LPGTPRNRPEIRSTQQTTPAMPSPGRTARLLSVVIPVHNEAEALAPLMERLRAALAAPGTEYEVVFVDDGSTDSTRTVVRALRERDPRVRLVGLSRNFGKESALSAGMDRARGDAVVLMDADQQDPPELIRDFLEHWRKGADVVYGVRADRSRDSALKRTTAGLFYRWFNATAEAPIPSGSGDFRLMDRRVVEVLRQMPERNRFMKGLFAWVGFSTVGVPYVREARRHGRTKFPALRLWRLAIDGITSFSTLPLRVWTYLGLVIATFAFVYGVVIIVRTLAFGADVPGYPSIMVVILFLGGIQLISLGVIGEYVSRLFIEAKQRPLYIVDEEL
jgi:glycosyltransferase involved in cell wall biosynthesis